MYVGGDYHSIMGGDIASLQNIEYNLRHGVKHLTVAVSKRTATAPASARAAEERRGPGEN